MDVELNHRLIKIRECASAVKYVSNNKSDSAEIKWCMFEEGIIVELSLGIRG